MARDVPVLLFGGTFDPVHNGHLHAVRCALELIADWHVRFIPCCIPPHRESPRASTSQRLDMLAMALTGTPFVVDDCEIRRGGTSWTLDTVRAQRQRYGARRSLCWLLGEDAYAYFHRWRGWKAILGTVHLLVCSRNASQPHAQEGGTRATARAANSLRHRPAGVVERLVTPLHPGSSSEIRAAIATRGEAPSAWLAPAVVRYIKQNNLYRDTPQ